MVALSTRHNRVWTHFQTSSLLQTPAIFFHVSWHGSFAQSKLHHPAVKLAYFNYCCKKIQKKSQTRVILNPFKSRLKRRRRRNVWPVFWPIDEFLVVKNLLLLPACLLFHLSRVFFFFWQSKPFCMDSCGLLSPLDYGVQSNTPSQLGTVDKTNVYRDSGEARFPPNRAGRAEFSWLLVRDRRTKGFLCCLGHGRPTGATALWSAAQRCCSQRHSFTSRLPDKVCTDSGLILPLYCSSLSALDRVRLFFKASSRVVEHRDRWFTFCSLKNKKTMAMILSSTES